MSDFEKAVSRSQLYDSDDNNDLSDSNNSDDNQEYTLPPPGFDFEIVDIDDIEDNNHLSDNGNKPVVDDAKSLKDIDDDDKVEFFPLFSTLGNTNLDSNNVSNLVQIKLDTAEEIVGEEPKNIKYDDSQWDEIATQRNKSFRPLSYYLQVGSITEAEMKKIQSVAVDGDTILAWSKKFKIESDYKLIDLKKYNSEIDLYHKIDTSKKSITSKKRPSKKKRDAKIFKKERIKKWKADLKQAKERAKREKFRQINNDQTSTKVKFGDSFNKRRNIGHNIAKSSTPNIISKNVGKPGRPVFRTE